MWNITSRKYIINHTWSGTWTCFSEISFIFFSYEVLFGCILSFPTILFEMPRFFIEPTFFITLLAFWIRPWCTSLIFPSLCRSTTDHHCFCSWGFYIGSSPRLLIQQSSYNSVIINCICWDKPHRCDQMIPGLQKWTQ